MLEKFTTKQFVFLALITALMFVVDMTLGSWIIAITGIPGTSALINTLLNLFILTISLLVLRKFGTATIIYGLYGLIALPTALAGGGPGFWPKVPLSIISGLLFEIPVILTGFKKRGFAVGLILLALGYLLYVPVYYLMGVPELQQIKKILIPGIIAVIVLGAIGIWLGFLVYNKIKNKSLVKQISG